jgi:hypothetical protein
LTAKLPSAECGKANDPSERRQGGPRFPRPRWREPRQRPQGIVERRSRARRAYPT